MVDYKIHQSARQLV
jgi:hypothetical protein